MIRTWFHKLLPVFLLAVIALIGVFSLLQPGFFPSHDGEWMVIRFSDFHRSLADGQWPVRWAGRLNFGFGYPVFNFLYPGTFYFTEIFHLLRFNFVDSVKTAFIVSYILSGVFMYAFVKEIFGKKAGIIASILYMFTPYRFVDMYVRGSLGESVAFMFPPLIFLSINNIFNSKKLFLWTAIGGLSLAGLITTHNVIAYLFLPIILFYILLFFMENKSIKFLVFGIKLLLLGLMLSCFFWLPAILEKKETIFDLVVISDFSKNFPGLMELIKPSWGFGPSNPGNPLSMSFQIGLINIAVIAISLITLFICRNKNTCKGENNLAGYFLLVSAVAIFFMTKYSQFLWNFIPGLSLIQFPWRILSITTFTSSVLIAYLFYKISDHLKSQVTLLFFVILVIFANINYLKPAEFVNRGDGYYSTNEDTTTVQNEYQPIKAKELKREKPASKVEILKSEGKIEIQKQKSNLLEFTYQGTGGLLQVNTVYFPGWQLYLNKTPERLSVNDTGLITLNVKEGINQIVLKFEETPVRKTADIITLVGLIFIIWLLIKSRLGILSV